MKTYHRMFFSNLYDRMTNPVGDILSVSCDYAPARPVKVSLNDLRWCGSARVQTVIGAISLLQLPLTEETVRAMSTGISRFYDKRRRKKYGQPARQLWETFYLESEE